MSAAEIQSKIKELLAKGVAKTGSDASEKVHLVKSVTVGGSPLGGGTTTPTQVLLKDAIFTSSKATTFKDNMLAGDRALTCAGDIVITQGDTVNQGAVSYIVKGMDIKAPTSIVLAYILHLRTQ